MLRQLISSLIFVLLISSTFQAEVLQSENIENISVTQLVDSLGMSQVHKTLRENDGNLVKIVFVYNSETQENSQKQFNYLSKVAESKQSNNHIQFFSLAADGNDEIEVVKQMKVTTFPNIIIINLGKKGYTIYDQVILSEQDNTEFQAVVDGNLDEIKYERLIHGERLRRSIGKDDRRKEAEERMQKRREQQKQEQEEMAKLTPEEQKERREAKKQQRQEEMEKQRKERELEREERREEMKRRRLEHGMDMDSFDFDEDMMMPPDIEEMMMRDGGDPDFDHRSPRGPRGPRGSPRDPRRTPEEMQKKRDEIRARADERRKKSREEL